MTEYIFYRRNVADPKGCPSTPMSEKQARELIACVRRDVDRAIVRLKRGDEIRTFYGTYIAIPKQ